VTSAEASPVAANVSGGVFTLPLANYLSGLPVPQAPFFVYATDAPMFGNTAMKAVYRLSFAADCDGRDHVYSTSWPEVLQLEVTDFCPSSPGVQSYRFDGIEGYVLSACPVQFSGCSNFSDGVRPQALHRRYSNIDNSYALIPASKLSLPQFQTYTTVLNGIDVLGYVPLNIDSDLDTLIDNYERHLGTNPNNSDSDCDGVSDGVEVPMLKTTTYWTNPLSGPC
jgi:hypothetical protein